MYDGKSMQEGEEESVEEDQTEAIKKRSGAEKATGRGGAVERH